MNSCWRSCCAESCLIAVLGGLRRSRCGLADHARRQPRAGDAADLLSSHREPRPRRWPRFSASASSPGSLPALQAMRLRIAVALRRQRLTVDTPCMINWLSQIVAVTFSICAPFPSAKAPPSPPPSASPASSRSSSACSRSRKVSARAMTVSGLAGRRHRAAQRRGQRNDQRPVARGDAPHRRCPGWRAMPTVRWRPPNFRHHQSSRNAPPAPMPTCRCAAWNTPAFDVRGDIQIVEGAASSPAATKSSSARAPRAFAGLDLGQDDSRRPERLEVVGIFTGGRRRRRIGNLDRRRRPPARLPSRRHVSVAFMRGSLRRRLPAIQGRADHQSATRK